MLGPLTAAVRRGKAGELDHVDLARVVGHSGKEVSPIDNVFSQKREMLVRLIEFDEEWSVPWSPPTPGPRRWRWSDRASPHWHPYALRCRLGNKHRSRALYYPSCLYSARINALEELRHISAKEARKGLALVGR